MAELPVSAYYDAVLASVEPWPPVPVPVPCRTCGEPTRDHLFTHDGRPVLRASTRKGRG